VQTPLLVIVGASVVLSVLGDALFVVKMRQSALWRALQEAGTPSPWVLVALPGLGSPRYLAFIMLRKYRTFLPPGSRLRLLGNVLYVLHWVVALGVPAIALRYMFNA
jgi:hypothetical protein